MYCNLLDNANIWVILQMLYNTDISMRAHTYTIAAIVAVVVVGTGLLVLHPSSFSSLSNTIESTNSTKKSTKTPAPPVVTTKPGFNMQQYSLTDPTSVWIVANKQRPLSPLTYTPGDLTSVGAGQLLRAEAASALTNLFTAAKTAGYTLVAESGYRSYVTQQSVYASEVKNFGQIKADTESAKPGYSEHQTGWAMDIASPGCIEDCFGKTQAAQWVLDNAYLYGFIRRYPDNKTSVTGYRNEPWHFRYVGIALATEMHTQRIETLEEFFGLPAAPNY